MLVLINRRVRNYSVTTLVESFDWHAGAARLHIDPRRERPKFRRITDQRRQVLVLRVPPIISPRPFAGRGVGGEGGSIRCRFSQSIPTFACPHPNPLPEGEGDFLG